MAKLLIHVFSELNNLVFRRGWNPSIKFIPSYTNIAEMQCIIDRVGNASQVIQRINFSSRKQTGKTLEHLLLNSMVNNYLTT